MITVYVCLDDRNGMLFNRRRQSRDAALLEDLRASVPGVLAIDAFSEKLIRDAGIPYIPAPEDLSELSEDAHFFCENRKPEELIPLTHKLVIYRWNRHYPADLRWDIDPMEAGFTLAHRLDFPGSSHETITKEVYIR